MIRIVGFNNNRETHLVGFKHLEGLSVNNRISIVIYHMALHRTSNSNVTIYPGWHLNRYKGLGAMDCGIDSATSLLH